MAVIEHSESEHETGVHLPSPSIWPVALAAGITLLGFGVLTNIVFMLSGIALIAISIGGWIRELLNE
jgi:hypothetical protein